MTSSSRRGPQKPLLETTWECTPLLSPSSWYVLHKALVHVNFFFFTQALCSCIFEAMGIFRSKEPESGVPNVLTRSFLVSRSSEWLSCLSSTLGCLPQTRSLIECGCRVWGPLLVLVEFLLAYVLLVTMVSHQNFYHFPLLSRFFGLVLVKSLALVEQMFL